MFVFGLAGKLEERRHQWHLIPGLSSIVGWPRNEYCKFLAAIEDVLCFHPISPPAELLRGNANKQKLWQKKSFELTKTFVDDDVMFDFIGTLDQKRRAATKERFLSR